jgi:solute carrier family 15 oligopeptide transporter 1
LYLTRKLKFDENSATLIYHGFTTLVYFCCVFGAIIADSWWGKFKTILILSCVYVSGSTLIALASIEPWNWPKTELTMVALFLIALGSGGIKPCVAAFGGEQFTLPQQAKLVAYFFSAFYFSINSGSLISMLITPIFRQDIECLGMNDCYPLAFGVPAVLMLTSIILFLCGKVLYKIFPPQGNMFVKVCKCVGVSMPRYLPLVL